MLAKLLKEFKNYTVNRLWTPDQGKPLGVEAIKPGIELVTDLPRIMSIADERIQIDPVEGTVTADGESVSSTPTEFDLLATLAKQPDRLVADSKLSEQVWGDSEFYQRSGSPYVVVKNLRQKLGKELGDTQNGAIKRRRGLGYMALSSLSGYSRPDQTDQTYIFADERIEVNVDQHFVVCDGEVIEDITPRQFRFLAHLASKPNLIISLRTLSIEEWGDHSLSTEQGVRVGVSQVRKILGPELGHVKNGAIKTKTDVGYQAVKKLQAAN